MPKKPAGGGGNNNNNFKIPEHFGVESEKEHNRTFDSADNHISLTQNYH